MGRRPGSANMPKRPQNEDPFLRYELESSNPSMKKAKFSSEITTELTNIAALRNNILKIAKVTPRRSQRIQNITSSEGRDIEPVFENIEASESEEDHQSYEKRKALEETLGPTTMDDKIDKLILLLEEQGRNFEALFSKDADWCFSPQNPINTGSAMKKGNFEGMYIDAQKKIDDLKKENSEIMKKLEITIAKLEGYEKGQLVLSESIDKLKDACLVSNLTKTMEMALGLSSAREILGHFASPTRLRKADSRATKRKVKTAKIEKGAANKVGK